MNCDRLRIHKHQFGPILIQVAEDGRWWKAQIFVDWLRGKLRTRQAAILRREAADSYMPRTAYGVRRVWLA